MRFALSRPRYNDSEGEARIFPSQSEAQDRVKLVYRQMNKWK
jgi:hypothetical protein